jgi:hypothetical protein
MRLFGPVRDWLTREFFHEEHQGHEGGEGCAPMRHARSSARQAETTWGWMGLVGIEGGIVGNGGALRFL